MSVVWVVVVAVRNVREGPWCGWTWFVSALSGHRVVGFLSALPLCSSQWHNCAPCPTPWVPTFHSELKHAVPQPRYLDSKTLPPPLQFNQVFLTAPSQSSSCALFLTPISALAAMLSVYCCTTNPEFPPHLSGILSVRTDNVCLSDTLYMYYGILWITLCNKNDKFRCYQFQW